MDWNNENTMSFIRFVRERPVMWDLLSAEYSDKYKRNEAFEEVSELMGITVEEAYLKWRVLRGQYIREKKSILCNQSQKNLKVLPPPKWFAFNEMERMCGVAPQWDLFSPGRDKKGNIVWNNVNTMSFIRLVQERPAIWDKEAPEHTKFDKTFALEEVAEQMNMSVKEVLLKWTSLRGQYNREKRRMIGIQSQKGLRHAPPPKWFAFTEMEKLCENNDSTDILPQQESFYDTGKDIDIKADIELTTSSPGSPSSPPPPEPIVPPPSGLSTSTLFVSTSPTPPNTYQPRSLGTSRITSGTSKDTLHRVNKEQNDPTTDPDDHISAFGIYVAAQVRKFNPRLQSKAKLEINKLLFNMEMEQHEYATSSGVEREHRGFPPDPLN